MKKLCLLLTVLMLLGAVTLAEESTPPIDLSEMSSDALLALDAQIDKELQDRSERESGVTIIEPGFYVAGSSIAPGAYVLTNVGDETAQIGIWPMGALTVGNYNDVLDMSIAPGEHFRIAVGEFYAIVINFDTSLAIQKVDMLGSTPTQNP